MRRWRLVIPASAACAALILGVGVYAWTQQRDFACRLPSDTRVTFAVHGQPLVEQIAGIRHPENPRDAAVEARDARLCTPARDAAIGQERLYLAAYAGGAIAVVGLLTAWAIRPRGAGEHALC